MYFTVKTIVVVVTNQGSEDSVAAHPTTRWPKLVLTHSCFERLLLLMVLCLSPPMLQLSPYTQNNNNKNDWLMCVVVCAKYCYASLARSVPFLFATFVVDSFHIFSFLLIKLILTYLTWTNLSNRSWLTLRKILWSATGKGLNLSLQANPKLDITNLSISI